MTTKESMKAMNRTWRRTLGLVALSAALAGGGCDGLLDENPKSILAPENFYGTADDAVSAVTGIYESLMGVYAWQWYLTDLATDDVLISASAGADMHQLAEYEFDESLWVIETVWGDSYRTINRANVVLDRVPGIDMDEALKTRLLGEARFLRALTYFNLVRMFGDLPLIDHEVTTLAQAEVGRTAASQVYDFIVTDLEQAASMLWSRAETETGRATAGAARGLLAKVHLERGAWQDAADAAGEVISDGEYALLEDWKDNFRIALENINDESIFEINYDHTLSWGSWIGLFILPEGLPGGDAYGLVTLTPELLALFAPEDERGLEGTYMTSPHTDLAGRTHSWVVPSGPAFNKFFDETAENNMEGRAWSQLDNNWIVLRYADVLLTYAEAVAQGATPSAPVTGVQALNLVRERAGLTPAGALDLAAVQGERRIEFVFEGHRWFDLRRWGQLEQAFMDKVGHGVPGDRIPLPRRELDLNPNLTQNPGW